MRLRLPMIGQGFGPGGNFRFSLGLFLKKSFERRVRVAKINARVDIAQERDSIFGHCDYSCGVGRITYMVLKLEEWRGTEVGGMEGYLLTVEVLR